MALYHAIADALRESIARGDFTIRSVLPPDERLAEHFGVSRMTVNRAVQVLCAEGLLQRRPGIGHRVLGPSPVPTSPSRKRAAEVHLGVVVPYLSESFGFGLFHAMADAADERRALLTLLRTFDERSLEEESIRRLRALPVDGLVLYPVNGETGGESLTQAIADHFPLVCIDRTLAFAHVPFIITDNEAGARHLTRHLIELGHRRIGFLSPPLQHTSTLEERYRGFLVELAEHGLSANPTHEWLGLPTGAIRRADERQSLLRPADHSRILTMLHSDLTALIVTEYPLAQEVLLLAAQARRRVPEDLSLVCFDSPGSLPPLITHVRQDERALGRSAVELLLRRVAGEPASSIASIRIPGHLIIAGTAAVCR